MRLAISTSPFARQQRHGAHLAQVHADRVVGLVERAGREIELELLGAFAGAVEQLVFAVGLLGVDDLDAGAAERAEQVVELVGRRDVGRQELVDLVVQQIALFLADGDELPHFVVFFFDRQRRVLLSSAPPSRHVSRPSAELDPLSCFHQASICCNRSFLAHQSASISASYRAAPCSCSRSISRWTAARSRSNRSCLSVRTQSAASAGALVWRAISCDQRGLSLYLDARSASQVRSPRAIPAGIAPARRISRVARPSRSSSFELRQRLHRLPPDPASGPKSGLVPPF